ncbi:hypothetical protein GTQ34_05685 [Muricauda sp. JGD-17]|uniref:Uncharacterized protein n=1 Tax=Flagellimonas ochracea TaxID=2696472 RepID=A0A964WWV5_9FLAO|nr:hypothetical protein [Allomuricauda ochracea]NAY91405.1 hypothetical protein [Allomuricauda ochracea]
MLIITALSFKKNILKPFLGVLEAFFRFKIIMTVLASIIYLELIILALSYVKFWDFILLKDTVFWYMGTGFITLLNLNKALEENDFFRRTVIDSFKFIVLFQFLVNVYSFNLVMEFILFPILAIIVVLDSLAEVKEEYRPIKKLTGTVLSLFGIFILIYAIYQVSVDFRDFSTWKTLKAFVFPVILTIGYIPFTYFLALLMKYENVFLRVGFRFKKDRKQFRSIKRKIILTCHISLSKLNKLSNINSFNHILKKEDLLDTIEEMKSL